MAGPTERGSATINTPTSGSTTTGKAAAAGDVMYVGLFSDLDGTDPVFYVGVGFGDSITTEDGDNLGTGGTGTRAYGLGASVNRTCDTSNGSTTVACAEAAAGDAYKNISGAGIPAGAQIVGVTAGTSYTISAAATATASGVTLAVSTIGPVAEAQVTGARCWIWRIKLTAGSANNFAITLQALGAGGNKRVELRCVTPAAGDTLPLRADALVDAVALTGSWSGSTTQTITGIATDSGKLVLYSLANLGSNTPTVTLDADNSGAGELSTSVNAAGNRSFLGLYDVGSASRPGSTVGLLATAAWGSPDAWCVLIERATNAQQLNVDAIASTTALGSVTLTRNDQLSLSAIAPTTVLGTVSLSQAGGTVDLDAIAATTVLGTVSVMRAWGAEFLMGPPGDGKAVIAARVTAHKLATTDSGEIRLRLKQAGVVVETGSWVTLTDTPTVIELTVAPPLPGTAFSLEWTVRTAGNLDPAVTAPELEDADAITPAAIAPSTALGTVVLTPGAAPLLIAAIAPTTALGAVSFVGGNIPAAAPGSLSELRQWLQDELRQIDRDCLVVSAARGVPGSRARGCVIVVGVERAFWDEATCTIEVRLAADTRPDLVEVELDDWCELVDAALSTRFGPCDWSTPTVDRQAHEFAVRARLTGLRTWPAVDS